MAQEINYAEIPFEEIQWPIANVWDYFTVYNRILEGFLETHEADPITVFDDEVTNDIDEIYLRARIDLAMTHMFLVDAGFNVMLQGDDEIIEHGVQSYECDDFTRED